MAHKYIRLLFFVFSILLCDSQGNAQTFEKVFGQPALNEGGLCVTGASDGNLLLGGFSSDSAMVMKISPLGNVIWAKTFLPIVAPNYVFGILQLALTPDNFIIGAGYARINSPYQVTGFYFKMDQNGAMQWCKYVNDPRPVYVQRIFAKSSTQYLMIEDIADQAPPTYDDVVASRIDASNGNVTWMSDRINYMSANSYIDDVSSATKGRNSSVYSTGRIYVNGSIQDGMRPYLSKFDNNGVIQFSKYEVFSDLDNAIIYGQDIIYDNDSLVISYRGSTTAIPLAYTNGLIKTDTLGNVIWSKDYDLTVSSCEIADKVLRLPNGYLLIGYTNEFGAPVTKHLFAIATDLNGNQLWAKIYGNLNTGIYDYYDSSSMAYVLGNTIFIAATQDNGTNTDIDFIATDLSGNIVCAPPTSTQVVQSDNPTNSTTCIMTYPAATLIYSSNSATASRTFPDQCGGNPIFGNDTTICGAYLLDATTQGATYQWQDGSTQPTFAVQGPGTYWVTENINCCLESDTIRFLPCISLSVPNVFTPNNDGSNDFFLVTTAGIETMDLKIYDRWGVLMTDLTSPQQGWDGKAKNGKNAVDGTYYYVLVAQSYDREYKASGFFTLIR